jgi:hypothetical protein
MTTQNKNSKLKLTIYDELQRAIHMVRVMKTRNTYRIVVGKPLKNVHLKDKR